MNPLPSMLPFAFFLFFLILLPPYVVPFDPRYLNCSANRCGELEITYPFRRIGVEADYCGHPYYGVECEEGDNLSMMIGDQKYEVLDITKENQSLTIVKKDVLKSICDLQQISPFVTLDHLFSFTDDDLNVTLLSYCPMLEPSSELHEFNCSHDQGGDHFLDLTQPPPDFLPPSCHKKQVIPMLKLAALDLTNNKNTVEAAAEALEKGFEVKWTLNTTECLACLNSKGECGYNTTLGKFSCFCEDGAHQSTCSGPRQMEASSRTLPC